MRTSPRIAAAAMVGALIVASFALSTSPRAAAATDACEGAAPTIVGTAGDDVIAGTPGDDVIAALAGNDTIDAGGGNDIVCGGPGNDTLMGNDGNDLLVGGAGDDAYDGGSGTDMASFAGAASEVDASLPTGRATGDGTDSLSGIEDLTGPSDAISVLTGDDGANVLIGGGDISVLSGGPGDDTLIGGARGWATLIGGKGDDTLIGGGRGDELDGGMGDDVLRAGGGGDGLVGGPGNDLIGGGTGEDVVRFLGANGPVTANLAVGTATGEGTDTLLRVEGVVGGRFGDRLVGNDRTNLLSGFGGNDRLNGGRGGYDTIMGGTGVDTCRNGARLRGCERTGTAASARRRQPPMRRVETR
jgi:Ca2+-binding RTX toxin-like protein